MPNNSLVSAYRSGYYREKAGVIASLRHPAGFWVVGPVEVCRAELPYLKGSTGVSATSRDAMKMEHMIVIHVVHVTYSICTANVSLMLLHGV